MTIYGVRPPHDSDFIIIGIRMLARLAIVAGVVAAAVKTIL